MKVLSVVLAATISARLLTLVQSQTCTLNELIIKGTCSVSSIFDANNSCTETALQTILGADYTQKIELACKEAYKAADARMLPWSAVTKRGYQFDKEYFNGGTIFNTETDPIDFTKDTARLVQIRDQLLRKHGIAWPSNIDNFNEETSCEASAAMCCWVASRDLKTHSTGEPIDNTDVCSHYIGNSQRSAHVEGGESVFVGDSGPVNCHGFYWDDSNRYKGNLLFHVAMSQGLLDHGYVRNVPGAPMCGCIEQMPVVSNAACTDITVSEDYQITLGDELHIKVIGDPTIDFVGCKGTTGNLRDGYLQSDLPGKITNHITADCTANEAATLDSLSYKKRADDDQWIPVAGKGFMYNPSVSMAEFNAIFAKSPNQIVRRRCFECDITHKDIYYRRYDINGLLPENLDLLHILKNYWYDIEGNKFHTDFEIYSTYEDALNNRNPWLYCNFNDQNVGFPRDCGPLTWTPNQWNAFEPLRNVHHGKYDVAFYIEAENNKVGLPRGE